jgi:mannose-1-phosphate guanylyltransferase
MVEHGYAVILAGGKGERFWPMSTRKRPKQLLSLVGDRPLLAQAVDRLEGLVPHERVFIITNADLVDASREAAPELPPENIIGEPVGRDTAAAAALGAALVGARDPEGVFAILTADHIMGDLDTYRDTLRESMNLAMQEDVLVTIGVQPDHPSTGYGYIEAGPLHSEREGVAFHKALRFVEKPKEEKAKSYLETGRYYWNSGMFIWSVKALGKALRTHRPPLADLIETLRPAVGTSGFDEALREVYASLEKISIDYALMEKADNILMVRGTFAWDDVGSWPALENHFGADEAGNVIIGDAAAVDTTDNIIVSKGRLTALIGVRDLVVVQTDGVTLVCPKDRAQDVKKLVEEVKKSGKYEAWL